MSATADRLKPGFSLYCDGLRLAAAFIVLMGHASHEKLSGGFLWQMGHAGHAAVVIFFVLSGYIIAYVSATREANLADYSAARLARLYSVVLPAILLTYLLDRIGMARDPSLYDAGRETMPLWRGAAAALFLSESWYKEVALFSNSSYWSLPYEFWYYVMFGAALFLKGKTRIAALIAAALIAGPNILLLFPNWLAGALAYRQSRRAPPGRWAPLLFWLSLLLAAGGYGAREAGMIASYSSDYLPFAYSLSDYIIAAGIALNLYAASSLEFAFLRPFKTPIREAAAVTFSLYLFHLPIMYCLASFVPAGLPLPLRFAGMVVTSFVICALLSRFTERHKDGLRDWLAGLFAGARKPALGDNT